MKRFIGVICDNLSNRGYNQAVEVYLLRNGNFPLLIGADYEIDSASTKGYKACAIDVACKRLGHKTDGYEFISKNIEMRVL